MQHPLLNLTYYQTFAIYIRPYATLGFPAGTKLDHEYFGTSFDDAATHFGDAMKDGTPAMVYEVDLAHGQMVDVTAEATDRLQHWCNLRGQDFPAWMTEPADDEGDAPEQRRYDAAKEARVAA